MCSKTRETDNIGKDNPEKRTTLGRTIQRNGQHWEGQSRETDNIGKDNPEKLTTLGRTIQILLLLYYVMGHKNNNKKLICKI